MIYVFKEYNRCGWRKIIGDLEDSNTVCEVLGLEEDSSFHQTPDKFLLRVPSWWFNYLFSIIYRYVLSEFYVAVDGTGFKTCNASSHYETCVGRKRKKRDYLKPIIGYDTKTQIILRVKIVRGNRNESPHMRSVLKPLTHARVVYADKGV